MELFKSSSKPPIAIDALQAPARARPSTYPEPFASRIAGREKRPLGELFDLSNFGVNLTRLVPGAGSALRHAVLSFAALASAAGWSMAQYAPNAHSIGDVLAFSKKGG